MSKTNACPSGLSLPSTPNSWGLTTGASHPSEVKCEREGRLLGVGVLEEDEDDEEVVDVEEVEGAVDVADVDNEEENDAEVELEPECEVDDREDDERELDEDEEADEDENVGGVPLALSAFLALSACGT